MLPIQSRSILTHLGHALEPESVHRGDTAAARAHQRCIVGTFYFNRFESFVQKIVVR